MVMGLSGLGSANISSLILNLESLSTEELDEYGLTPSALNAMVKLLERVENIIEDGIQKDEIEELQGIVKNMANLVSCSIPTLESLDKNVNMLKETIEELNEIAPGLAEKVLSSSKGKSLTSSIGSGINAGVLESKLDLAIEEEQSNMGLQEDDDEADAQAIQRMLERQIVDKRAESIQQLQDINRLKKALKDKLKQTNIDPSGNRPSSMLAKGFTANAQTSTVGKIEGAFGFDLAANKPKVDPDKKNERQTLERLKEKEQEIINRSQEADKILDKIVSDSFSLVTNTLVTSTINAIEAKVDGLDDALNNIGI